MTRVKLILNHRRREIRVWNGVEQTGDCGSECDMRGSKFRAKTVLGTTTTYGKLG